MTRRARSIAVELWFPDTPVEKVLAQPPPSDDGPWLPVELWLPDTPAADAPPAKQPRVRKPTLTHALKEAARAGVAVKSVTVEGERLRLELGQPAAIREAPATDADEVEAWIKKQDHAH
jgi:hypothetical protein